jgi:hypothetical protein
VYKSSGEQTLLECTGQSIRERGGLGRESHRCADFPSIIIQSSVSTEEGRATRKDHREEYPAMAKALPGDGIY